MTERASNTVSAGKTAGGRQAGAIAFDDAALVEQCRRGDMQAFAALVAKYQDRIFNTVFRMCQSRADAEELAQETFLRALERLSQFRGESKFYTWLFRIAANLAISHGRRSARIRFHPLAGPERADGAQAQNLAGVLADRREPEPQAAAMSAETNQRITESLEQLSDEARLVVILRDIEEMNYAQIADVTDLPVGTVKSRLHRARGMLKQMLADLVEQS